MRIAFLPSLILIFNSSFSQTFTEQINIIRDSIASLKEDYKIQTEKYNQNLNGLTNLLDSLETSNTSLLSLSQKLKNSKKSRLCKKFTSIIDIHNYKFYMFFCF